MRVNNHRGLISLEYSLLLAIIVASLLSMQIYIKRGIQGRLRSYSQSLGSQQYSPGHATSESSSQIFTQTTENNTDTGGLTSVETLQTINRTSNESVDRQ